MVTLQPTMKVTYPFKRSQIPTNRYVLHPVVRGALVKRIPRSARASCAALWDKLIEAVVRELEDNGKWSDLVAFGECILATQKRGGVKRKLTRIISSGITN